MTIATFCCLLPQCNATFSDPEALDQHVATHFTNDSSEGPTGNFIPTPFHPLHPTNGNSAAAVSPYAIHHGTTPTCTNMTSPSSSSVPNTAASATPPLAPEQDPINKSRVRCPRCDTLFKRHADMERHAKSHDNSREFQCPVLGCTYRGYYRKDKVN